MTVAIFEMEKEYFQLPYDWHDYAPNRRATEGECARALIMLKHCGVNASRTLGEDEYIYVDVSYEHPKGARLTDGNELYFPDGFGGAVTAAPKRFDPNKIIQCMFRLHDAEVIDCANSMLARDLCEATVWHHWNKVFGATATDQIDRLLFEKDGIVTCFLKDGPIKEEINHRPEQEYCKQDIVDRLNESIGDKVIHRMRVGWR